MLMDTNSMDLAIRGQELGVVYSILTVVYR